MTAIFNLRFAQPRRDFLKAGAGLTLGVILAPNVFAQAAGPGRAGGEVVAKAALEPNAFVRIGADNTVTVIAKHIEGGGAPHPGAPPRAAGAPAAVGPQTRGGGAPADGSRYNNLFWGQAQGTGGSTALANSYEQLRKAGATARAMLVAAAAQKWGVPASQITVSKGLVQHQKGKLTFGELAADAASQPVPAEVALKDPKEFAYIGKPAARTDARAKSNGSAMFTQDVKLPGMLTAVVLHPERFGAKLKSFDAAKAKAVKGVVDVVAFSTPATNGVAVLARDYWSAKKGRDALSAEWDETGAFRLGSAEIMAEYKKLALTQGTVARKDGDVERAVKDAPRTLEAAYEFPYLAHASMEPMNCVVKLDANSEKAGCEIWNGEQFQTIDQAVVAKLLGLKPEQVKLNMLYAGGSFGRRANPQSDFVLEAAAIAKAIDARAPVKLGWGREDGMRAGYYRPMYYHSLEEGPVPAAPRAPRQAPAPQGGARARRAEGGLGQAPGGRTLAWHRGARVVQYLRRPGGGDLEEERRLAQARARRLRGRLRRRRQPEHHRHADGVGHRLRPVRRADGRNHAEGRQGRAVQLPRLPGAAHQPDAAG